MSDDRLESALRQLARDSTAPPATPREEIWSRIQAKRGADMLRQRRLRRWHGRLRWGAGIAAVLLIGIGLGRWSARTGAPEPEMAGAEAPSGELAYRVTATQHLSQAEVLLTAAQSAAVPDRLDAQTLSWAGELLTTTRLLLDSPAAQDPELRGLLEDLELVLVQIAHLRASPEGTPEAEWELELVRESIEQGDVLPRLRTAIPSGVPVAAS